MPDETPAVASVGQRILSFGAFWLSMLVLIGSGLVLFYQAEVKGPWESFGFWVWEITTGDTLGLFFTGMVGFLFVVTFWSFVFAKQRGQ